MAADGPLRSPKRIWRVRRQMRRVASRHRRHLIALRAVAAAGGAVDARLTDCNRRAP